MAFRKLTTIVAAMATISMCAAVPGSDVPAIERSADDLVIVTMYSDINWSGSSQKFTIQTQNTCFSLGGTPWDNVISSIKIPSGYRCRFWDSNSCNGDSTPDIYAPGAYSIPNGMNDRATSFKCYVN